MTETAVKKHKLTKPLKALLAGYPRYPFCAGCQHPMTQRAICEALEELGAIDKALYIPGVGCGAFLMLDFDVDMIHACHGRAPDYATAAKRLHPDMLVFTAQGDGDCISIGAGPLIGALTRGEKITIIMENNAEYGMTGGQMAPTTLQNQVTTTTPLGRTADFAGYPVHTAEMVATFRSVAYSARGAYTTPHNYLMTKHYIKTAFQKQLDNIGLSFVEVLSACPSNWHLSPLESLKFIEEKMIKEYPLGEFKNVDKID